MKTQTKNTAAALLPAIASLAIAAQVAAAELTVTVSPISQSEGVVMLAVYDSEQNFRETVATGQRAAAVEGEMTFTFSNLIPGEYAIMVIHDINNNDKLDTNLFGIPNEPWGGSLQGRTVFGAPGWKDTRFDLTEDGLSVTVALN